MRRHALRLSLLAFALPTLLAAALVRNQHVGAELVAEPAAIEPGKPFTVGLRLVHDAHWHTYWKASTTGYANSIEWDLPPGFTAGPLQWPVPRTYEMGGLVEFVYEGEVLLPVTITPPVDLPVGGEVTLRARAEWLMCKDVCIPGGVDLRLSLPVRAASTPNADTAGLFASARDALPVAQTPFEAVAWRVGDAIFLALSGHGTPLPPDLYYFDAQTFLTPQMEQTVKRPSADTALIELSVDPAGNIIPERLRGVLATREGSWLDGARRPGWELDLAWSAGPPSFLAASSATGADGTPADAGQRSLLAVLGLAFVGGFILNLMPCVFPVIGIKIMGFVNQAGEARGKIVAHGLTFTAGVLVSFWVLAGLLIILRSGGAELGWGWQLQNPGFVYLLAAFLFVFGLNMSGLFEIGTSAMGVGSQLSSRSGLTGSFFSGVLATVVATPCAAPFLAPALGAALALPPVTSLVVFTAIGLGLSLPYLLLSAFPGLIHRLPRPGPWMETFKQFLSFLLYATAGYLLWVLVGQMVEDEGYLADALLWSIFGLVLIALGAWIYGRWGAAHRPARVRRTGVVIALLAVAGGIGMGFPHPAFDPAALAETDAPPVEWQKWAPGKAAELAAEGNLVYVDFTARWCTTCQVNKKAVFSSAEVRRFFAENKVVALKADWTNKDPEIARALAAFDRTAVPFNLVYAPGQAEPVLLPELLTPGIVLDHLRQATGG